MELEWKWLREKLIKNNYKIDLDKILLDKKETLREIKAFREYKYLKEEALKNDIINDFLKFIKENDYKFKEIKNLPDSFSIFFENNINLIDIFFEKYINIIENDKLLNLLLNCFGNFSSLIYDSYLLHTLIRFGGNSIYRKTNTNYQWSFFYKIAFKEILSYFEIAKTKFEFILTKFFLLNYGNKINLYYGDNDYIFSFIEKNNFNNDENEFFLNKKRKRYLNEFKLEFIDFEKKNTKKWKICEKKWNNNWYRQHENIFKILRNRRNGFEHSYNQDDLINYVLPEKLNFEISEKEEEVILRLEFDIYKISLFLFFSFLLYLENKIEINIDQKINENISYLEKKWFFDEIKEIDNLKYYYDFYNWRNTENLTIIKSILYKCKK